MPERIDWLDHGSADGDPHSSRFADRYHSELGGVSQSRDIFLAGCGLPDAWVGQPQWRILETGFGLGLNFLVTWQAWRADPLRPRLLHFVSTQACPTSPADVLSAARAHPELLPLANALQQQLWGLLPGFHRVALDEGRVLLTLCIGDTKKMLRQQVFEADSVFLDGFNPAVNPGTWDIHTFKAVARCCRRGTRIATWTVARNVRDALAQAGFVVHKTPGASPKRDKLQGQYNPAWEPKKAPGLPSVQTRKPGHCVIVGAGLAGAAAAASLARRGWQVLVLDAADAPASGASGLPAGLLVPHVSPDDSVLSRLSRSGFRVTYQQLDALRADPLICSMTGVLEHSPPADDTATATATARRLPESWSGQWLDPASDWSRLACAEQLAACELPPDASALWHAKAGWIKPAKLVEYWLGTPGVEWRGQARVTGLVKGLHGWQILGADGKTVAEASLVVIAGGFDSRALAAWACSANSGAEDPADVLQLQAVRGQVSYAAHAAFGSAADNLPPFPVNGHGSLIPAVPFDDRQLWCLGSSFERDMNAPHIKAADHAANLERLAALLPQTAAQLAPEFFANRVEAWAGVRCTSPARLPVLGQIASTGDAAVWVSTAMGSRGLTFAALCGELLAAQLHGEPLPVELSVLQALQPSVSRKSSNC